MRSIFRLSLVALISVSVMVLPVDSSAQAVRRSSRSSENTTQNASRGSSQSESRESARTTRQSAAPQTRSNSDNKAVTPDKPQARPAQSRPADQTKSAQSKPAQARPADQTPVRSNQVQRRQGSQTGQSSQQAGQAAQTPQVRESVSSKDRQPVRTSISGQSSHSKISSDNNRNIVRIPPRERDVRPEPPRSFYGKDPHYFGYKAPAPPKRNLKKYTYYGRDYYYYNNVFYRLVGGHYYVSRPYYGYVVDIVLGDRYFPTVRFAYYSNVYRQYNIMDRNWDVIQRQNRTIAQNNALLSRQYASLALNASRALNAADLASALGLVQSYASISDDYFYEDGIFYSRRRDGRYEVIVPPAGALVDQLPDDYEIIVFGGVEYYRVDDTVYRLTLVDGMPLLEVLGQMPYSMYSKYNY